MTSQIWCDIYSMNHDPEYWEDPWTFNPDRFLDDEGQLVGADHPNRRRWVSLSPELCDVESIME